MTAGIIPLSFQLHVTARQIGGAGSGLTLLTGQNSCLDPIQIWRPRTVTAGALLGQSYPVQPNKRFFNPCRCILMSGASLLSGHELLRAEHRLHQI